MKSMSRIGATLAGVGLAAAAAKAALSPDRDAEPRPAAPKTYKKKSYPNAAAIRLMDSERRQYWTGRAREADMMPWKRKALRKGYGLAAGAVQDKSQDPYPLTRQIMRARLRKKPNPLTGAEP